VSGVEQRVEQLLLLAESQQAMLADLTKIAGQQAEQIGLLVQSVALLMGEELGAPAGDEEESPRVDSDGHLY